MARLSVRVQPGASKDELRLDGAVLHARLTAPAVEGKANKRLIDVLSAALRVRRSQLAIVRGETSRNKVVEVAELDSAQLLARLGGGAQPAGTGGDERRPFPNSLCHGCDAPPKYIRTGRSTFILCPRLPVKYPRQPVVDCEGFRPRTEPPKG